MRPSPWLFEFLKNMVRFRPTAYLPTKGAKLTLGWGHTGVSEGDTCTSEQAETWLLLDVARISDSVNELVTVPVTQNQFDALCSLAFSIGVDTFAESYLLRLLNDGHPDTAACEFPQWCRIAGRSEIDSLVNRRFAELNRFLAP